MVKAPPGLKAQLLLGLLMIILVASTSVGVITTWTMRSQIAEIQITNARTLGYAVARVLASGLDGRGLHGLQRVVSSVTTGGIVRRALVVDPGMVVRASSYAAIIGRPLGGVGAVQAVRTEQQVVRLLGEPRPRIITCTPLFSGGSLKGVVQLEQSMAAQGLRWPVVFWILMGINGLLLLTFISFVLTRYVILPVENMRRAAVRVTDGDLSVRLVEGGAAEFFSLAASFNTMTRSVAEQLDRLDRQRRQLASSREQVIRSEKLASVGRLAAGVAHEVGNPLQSIVGFTDVLLGGGLEEEQVDDFLRRVQGETQRIHLIIRELLDYARPVEDEVEPVRLGAVVEQALQLVGPQKKLQEVDLVKQGLEDLPAVVANNQRLVQVLLNLVLNAADAVAGQGTVTFRAAADDDDDRKVKLWISDTGAPMARGDRERIFDPFFTTKEPGAGTGLGLSVARSIVESYGGRLALTEDAQTTFLLELDRWQDQGAAGEEP